MVVTISQILCILFLWIFIVYAIIDCVRVSKREPEEVHDNEWRIVASRVGKAKYTFTHWLMRKKQFSDVIVQPMGRYTAGNHMGDDIYVDSSRDKVRIHLNMLKDHVRLTVMKGEVIFRNCLLTADCEKEIRLYDGDSLILGDIQLRFLKGGVDHW